MKLSDYGEVVQIQFAKSISHLYSPAREKALTSRNIKAGWSKTGLFPFNPDRVLGDIQMPPGILTLPNAGEVEMVTPLQDEVVQTPVTPATPVTVDALMSLRGLIEQDAHKLDEASKRRLQRRLQKLSNAAEIFLAERTLLQDENQLLFKQNNEAKARRLTKSTVIGKAKVMS
jgi:hypothetical protein